MRSRWIARITCLAAAMLIAGAIVPAAGAATNSVIWDWGYNAYGQLGNGCNTSCSNGNFDDTPGAIFFPATRNTHQTIAGDGNHTLALDSSGNVWAWGDNSNGDLGLGATNPGEKDTPQQVTDPGSPNPMATFTFLEVAGRSGNHSLALRSDHTVWAWGEGDHGELGNGGTTDSSVPVQVMCSVATQCPARPTRGIPAAALSNITMIASGGNHNLALQKLPNGAEQLWAWGDDANGDLGDGGTVQENAAVRVSQIWAPATLTEITAAGDNANAGFSLALDSTGKMWAWGENNHGQIGNGSTTPSFYPTPVSSSTGLSTILHIAVGGSEVQGGHSLAIDSNNHVWAWGNNDVGQLGDGSTAQQLSPEQITGSGSKNPKIGKTFTDIAGGGYFSLARDGSGNVFSWGNNTNGQLGYATTGGTCAVYDDNCSLTPQQIPAGTINGSVSRIEAGDSFSLALVG